MNEEKPFMLLPNAMKQYQNELSSSVIIRVIVPGFIFSNIAKYEGNIANESSADPLCLPIIAISSFVVVFARMLEINLLYPKQLI